MKLQLNIAKSLLSVTLCLLYVNCYSTKNATRLEKHSSLIINEGELFGESISKFGKLNPMIERKTYGANVDYPIDEYYKINRETETYSEIFCNQIGNSTIIDYNQALRLLSDYINNHNINLQILEKNMNYREASEARSECTFQDQRKTHIMERIVKYLQKIKYDIDNPNKLNRENLLLDIEKRIGTFNQNDSELNLSEYYQKKNIQNKKYSEFYEKVKDITNIEYNIAEYSWRLLYLINAFDQSPPSTFKTLRHFAFFSTIGYSIFAPNLVDRETALTIRKADNIQFYEDRFIDAMSILNDCHYILINEDNEKIPGFEELLTSIEFQLNNYDELLFYFQSKNNIRFKTEKFQKLCDMYSCNRKPDLIILEENAKNSLEKLELKNKIRKSIVKTTENI
jgi:hypothetical protein